MNRYLDKFMATFPFEGLTYDDVTLVTQYADFLPDDASLETNLTSRQKMKIPFISAAMDTVTEAPMAIAMALAGGRKEVYLSCLAEVYSDNLTLTVGVNLDDVARVNRRLFSHLLFLFAHYIIL